MDKRLTEAKLRKIEKGNDRNFWIFWADARLLFAEIRALWRERRQRDKEKTND